MTDIIDNVLHNLADNVRDSVIAGNLELGELIESAKAQLLTQGEATKDLSADDKNLYQQNAWNLYEGTNTPQAQQQEPVMKVTNNGSQLSLTKPDGSYWDMSKHIGDVFYTTPQVTQQEPSRCDCCGKGNMYCNECGTLVLDASVKNTQQKLDKARHAIRCALDCKTLTGDFESVEAILEQALKDTE